MQLSVMPEAKNQTNERIAEIGEILAAGLMRELAPKSSPKSLEPGEVLLDFSGHQSGHRAPANGRGQDD